MHCPKCGNEMLPGHQTSGLSVYWLYDSDGPSRKMLGLGQNLQGNRFVRASKINGWHCPQCRFLIIPDVDLIPPEQG